MFILKCIRVAMIRTFSFFFTKHYCRMFVNKYAICSSRDNVLKQYMVLAVICRHMFVLIENGR